MKIKFYPPPPQHSPEEIEKGIIWLSCDCGKEQAVSNLRNGCCVRCGKKK